MKITNLMAIMLLSLCIIDHAKAIVEIDAKIQMRLDNALNKMYFKGPSGLQMLTAHKNASSKNITEEDINDIEEEKDLQNYANVLVYIDLNIGSNQEPYTILFDTGSTWLFVQSRICDNCDKWSSSIFDERNSTSFGFYPALLDLQYGSGGIYGHLGYDKVCLQPNRTCAESFSFLTVSHMALGGNSGLPVSGLLGMSPRGGSQNLLIDQIKENGDIDQKVFSIYIDWDNMNSKISFGGYNLTKYAHHHHQSLNFITLANANSTTMWFIDFEGMKTIAPENAPVQQKKAYANLTIPGNKILIDSGTSFVLLPYTERKKIVDLVNELNPSFNCTHGQISICNCADEKDVEAFPDIRFMIGGRDYFIPVKDYIFYDWTAGKCYNTLISLQGLNFYIMGLNFFKNYYTVFDQEQMRVGFTLSNRASYRVQQLTEEYDMARNASMYTNSTTKEEMINSLGLETDDGIVEETPAESNGENKLNTTIQVTFGLVLAITMFYFGSKLIKKKEQAVKAQGEYVVL